MRKFTNKFEAYNDRLINRIIKRKIFFETKLVF